MKIGITLGEAKGIGDKIQFTAVPENYFRATGQKLIDMDKAWVFDHNPYVVRDAVPSRIVDLWAANPANPMPGGRPLYTSLSERNNAMMGIHSTPLRHPRLYLFEEPLQSNEKVLVLHTTGSPGIHDWRGYDHPMQMTPEVIEHVKESYMTRGYVIIQVGAKTDVDAGVIDKRGEDLWSTVKIISQADVFIGVDSGPSWIAACYPRIFNKKVLMQAPLQLLQDYIPLQIKNSGTHWHDYGFQYYNRFKVDSGITFSYLKL